MSFIGVNVQGRLYFRPEPRDVAHGPGDVVKTIAYIVLVAAIFGASFAAVLAAPAQGLVS